MNFSFFADDGFMAMDLEMLERGWFKKTEIAELKDVSRRETKSKPFIFSSPGVKPGELLWLSLSLFFLGKIHQN